MVVPLLWQGGKRLFEALGTGLYPKLSSIRLDTNELTGSSCGLPMQAFLSMAGCSLKLLTLNDNKLDGKLLTNLIKSNASLTDIEFMRNPVQTKALHAISQFLLSPACQCRLRSIRCNELELDPMRKQLDFTGEPVDPSVLQARPMIRAPLARHSLLTARHSLLTARHSLLTARHSPLATRHSPLATRHSPLATRHSLLATHYSLLTTHCPLLTTYCSPLAAHHSPLTTRRSPLAAHHSPLTPHHSPLTTRRSPLAAHHSPLTPHHSPLTTRRSPTTTHHPTPTPHPPPLTTPHCSPLKLLAGVLRFNSSLEVLKLGNIVPPLDATSARAFQSALETNQTLQELDFSGNTIHTSQDGMAAVASMVQQSSSLSSITLEAVALPVKKLNGIDSADALDLSSQKLGRLSAVVMGALMVNNSAMRELNLRDNRFGPDGGKAVLASLPKSLRTLNLGDNTDMWGLGESNGRSDLSAETETEMLQEQRAILAGLGRLPQLEKLQLDGNGLSSAKELANVCQCVELTALHIQNNAFNDLCSNIGQLRSLRELVATNNRITELPIAIGSLQRLELLDLDNNRLTHLPIEIGQCSTLKQLNVINNKLTELPRQVDVWRPPWAPKCCACRVPRAACRVPRAACCVLRAACCVPRAACRVLRAACCVPRAACCVPLGACGLLLAACCLLLRRAICYL